MASVATPQRWRIYSWNVNGLRANLKRGTFQEFMQSERPGVLCLQEIKMKPGQALLDLPDYEEFWNSAERPGYSGTAVLTQTPPQSYFAGFDDEIGAAYAWADDAHGDPLTEGRVQTLEFPQFFLVNVYVPNSKRDLTRLGLRHEVWDPALVRFLKALERTKPVVVCGDFNAAHREIDLARPKDNQHNAGFTPEERAGIDRLLAAGFVDTFRQLSPEAVRYTWWAAFRQARARNIGWRIDYFFISKALLPNLRAAEIHEHILGSDHCPVSIELEFA